MNVLGKNIKGIQDTEKHSKSLMPGMVADAYMPSYSEGRDRWITIWGQVKQS
jgi:hypothetical protein